MWLRLVVGAGLFALGYYLGKEVERTKPVREELDRARDARAAAAQGKAHGTAGSQAPEDEA